GFRSVGRAPGRQRTRPSPIQWQAPASRLARRAGRTATAFKRGRPLGRRPSRSRGRVTASRASRKTPSKGSFSVGIDLGTTNCALACADLRNEAGHSIDVLPVPQLVDAGEVASPTLLPSFLYVVGEFDFPPGSLRLPWDPATDGSAPSYIVGELARK